MSPDEVAAYRALAAEVLVMAVADARRLRQPGILTGLASSTTGRLWLGWLRLHPDAVREMAHRATYG